MLRWKASWYPYLIAATATFATVASIPGQTSGVSAFTDYLTAAYGISRSQLSMAFMLGTLLSSFLLPYAGRQLDRIGSKKMIIRAGISLAVALCVLACGPITLDYLPKGPVSGVLVAAFAFLGIRHFGQGQLTMIARTITGRWFRENLGLVTGVTGMVVSLAFGIAPLALVSLINKVGWYTGMVSLSAVALAAAALGGLVFKEPLGVHNPHLPVGVATGHTLTEVKQNGQFWLYLAAMTLQGLLVTAYTFHFTGLAHSLGLNAEAGFKIFIPIAIVSTITNFVASYYSDRYSLKWQLRALLLALTVATFAAQFLQSTAGYTLVAIMYGVSGGVYTCLISVSWPKLFGTRELGAISGYSLGWIVFGSAIGPYLVSLLESDFLPLNRAFSCLAVLPAGVLVMSLRRRAFQGETVILVAKGSSVIVSAVGDPRSTTGLQ